MAKHSEEKYELGCIKKFESPNAVLIRDLATGEELWIPFSQVFEMHFNQEGEGRIVMSVWIAKKKGLI